MEQNVDDYFEIAGETYYLDLEQVTEFIKLEKKEDIIHNILKEKEINPLDDEDEEDEIQNPSEQMIDLTKWELTKAMIDVLLSENNLIDEDMGHDHLAKSLSIPFRISFNTLLKNKIIKKQ